MDIHAKVNSLKSKIKISNNILIVPSSPLDYDSIGTSLALKWFIEKKYLKEPTIIFFSNVTSDTSKFSEFKTSFKQSHPSKVNFKDYDLIITLDGNSVRQFFTSDFLHYIFNYDYLRIFNIDHHKKGPIEEVIESNTIRVEDCSTTKVLYDLFLKDDVQITKDVATWLYLGLIGDTGNFRWGIFKDTFLFAQTLLNFGVDHYNAIDFRVSKEVMDFTSWAIENTKYSAESKSTFLIFNKETKDYLTEKFSKSWENDYFLKFFTSEFANKVEGFDYFFILKESKDLNTTKVIWRCNPQSSLSILEFLKELGIVANGHRNAGGGLSNFKIMETYNLINLKLQAKLNSAI